MTIRVGSVPYFFVGNQICVGPLALQRLVCLNVKEDVYRICTCVLTECYGMIPKFTNSAFIRFFMFRNANTG